MNSQIFFWIQPLKKKNLNTDIFLPRNSYAGKWNSKLKIRMRLRQAGGGDKVHGWQSMKWTKVTGSWEKDGKPWHMSYFDHQDMIMLRVCWSQANQGSGFAKSHSKRGKIYSQVKHKRQRNISRPAQRERERLKGRLPLGSPQVCLFIMLLVWFRGVDVDRDCLLKLTEVVLWKVTASHNPQKTSRVENIQGTERS